MVLALAKKAFSIARRPFSAGGLATGGALFLGAQAAKKMIELKSQEMSSYIGEASFEKRYGAGRDLLTGGLSATSYIMGGLGLFKMDPFSRAAASVGRASSYVSMKAAKWGYGRAQTAYDKAVNKLWSVKGANQGIDAEIRHMRRLSRGVRPLTGGHVPPRTPGYTKGRRHLAPGFTDKLRLLRSRRSISRFAVQHHEGRAQAALARRTNAGQQVSQSAADFERYTNSSRMGPITMGLAVGVGASAFTDPNVGVGVGTVTTAGLYAVGGIRSLIKHPKASLGTLGFTSLMVPPLLAGAALGYERPMYPVAEGNIIDYRHDTQKTISKMDFNTAGLSLALHYNRKE